MVTAKHNKRYLSLLKIMFNTNFRWTVERDRNREMEGLHLRDLYSIETGTQIDSSIPCSVLEMLVALCIRMDKDVIGDDDNLYLQEWFEKLLDNLGLCDFINNKISKDEVEQILQRWMDREYSRDGTGGLFPLLKPNFDQREAEIWVQMNSYIIENVDI